MKYINCLVLGLFMILLASCSNEIQYKAPRFNSKTEIGAQPVSEIIPTAGGIIGLESYKNYFVVIGYMNEKYIHLYDKITGKLVASNVGKGRAENEIINVSSYSFDESSSEIILFSSMNQKILRINISKAPEFIIEQVSDYKLNSGLTNIQTLDSNSYLKISVLFKSSTNHRLSITSNDREVSSYDKLPIDDIQKTCRIYAQPVVKLSSDRSKLVIGTSEGLILETFSLENNKIRALNTSYFFESIIIKSEADVSEMYWGVSDFLPTNDYIYAVYLGNKGRGHTYKLAKFDWNHTPLELIDIEGYNLSRICMVDGAIYAFAKDLTDQEYRIISINQDRKITGLGSSE